MSPDVIVDEVADDDEYNDAFDATTTIMPPTTTTNNINDGSNVNGPSRHRTNVGEENTANENVDDDDDDETSYSTTNTGLVIPSTFSIEDDDDAYASSSSPEDEEGSPIMAKASSASIITAIDENDESILLPEDVKVEVEEERRKQRQLYPKRLHLDDDDDDDDDDEGTTMKKSSSTTSYGINGVVVGDKNDERTIMEVSVALEALEAMRRLNLEMEFAAATTTHANKTTTTTTTTNSSSQCILQQQLLRHDDCTFCQREKLRLYITKKMNSTTTTTSSSYNTEKNDIVVSMELDDKKNRGNSTTTTTTTTRNGLFSTRIIEDDLRATNSPGFDPVFSFDNNNDDDDDDDTVDDMPSGRELLDTGYFSRRNNNSNGGGGVIDESSVTRSNCDFDSGSGGGSGATKIGKREIMGSNEVSTNSNNTLVNGDKEEIVASDNGDNSRMIRRLNSSIGKLFSFRGPATAHAADVVVQDTINNDVKVRSETAMMIEALADSAAAAAAAGKKKVEKKPYRSIRKNEIDDNGRCVYHNEIQLQKHTDDGLWITVRKKCPECITEDTSSSPAEKNTTTVSSSSKNTEIVVRRDNRDNNSTTRTTTPDDRIHRSFFSRSAPAPSRPPPLVRNILKKVNPCLTCGHPTCPRHSSSAFSKNNIPMCQQCAYLFELDFIVEIVTSSSSNIAECRRKVDEMVDCYDRAKLLLSYTAAYAEDIALALEAMSANSNMIGAGSSVTSIGSGIASIVGCGILLLVPPAALVGVHLMVAGLVVGGGATAVQTGDEMVRYYSEPNRLAERMVALHGMATSLLRVREVLSHVLLKSNSYDAVSPVEEDEEGLAQRARLAGEIKVLMEKHNVTEKKGNTATAKLMGKGARYIGRICSTASVIPVAGGILSAASIYFEGNELKKTITRISEGSPCDKAQQVRSIRDELDMLPDSSLILEECRLVFDLAQKEKSNKITSSSKDV